MMRLHSVKKRSHKEKMADDAREANMREQFPQLEAQVALLKNRQGDNEH